MMSATEGITEKSFPLWSTIGLIVGSAAAMLAAAVVVVFVALGMHLTTFAAFSADPIPLAVLAQSIGYIPSFGFLLQVTKPATHVTWYSMGMRMPTWTHVLWGVAAGLSSLIAVTALAFIIMRLTGLRVDDSAHLLGKHPTSFQFLILALVAMIGAPLTEEMIFRGIILNALLVRYGWTVGIVGSAILFSTMHLSLVNFVPLFVVGLLLGIAYKKTKNLWTTIIGHITFNGFGITLLLLQHR